MEKPEDALSEILLAVYLEVIEFYKQEFNITEDTMEIELRPPALQQKIEILLRRELIVAAKEGHTDLANKMADYISKPKDYVLHAGYMSAIKLYAEGGGKVYTLPINERALRWLEMEENSYHATTLN